MRSQPLSQRFGGLVNHGDQLRFVMLPVPTNQDELDAQRIAYADLAKHTVEAKSGKLVIATDAPPNATGHVAMHLRLPDADEWVAALTQAGAVQAA